MHEDRLVSYRSDITVDIPGNEVLPCALCQEFVLTLFDWLVKVIEPKPQ